MEGGSGSFGNPGGRRGLKSVPSVVGVWIFSGITHSFFVTCRQEQVFLSTDKSTGAHFLKPI